MELYEGPITGLAVRYLKATQALKLESMQAIKSYVAIAKLIYTAKSS